MDELAGKGRRLVIRTANHIHEGLALPVDDQGIRAEAKSTLGHRRRIQHHPGSAFHALRDIRIRPRRQLLTARFSATGHGQIDTLVLTAKTQSIWPGSS